MKLLTSAQRAKLLDNGRRQAAVKGTPAELDFQPVVKLFTPDAQCTWLLTEIDPDDGLRRRGHGAEDIGRAIKVATTPVMALVSPRSIATTGCASEVMGLKTSAGPSRCRQLQ